MTFAAVRLAALVILALLAVARGAHATDAAALIALARDEAIALGDGGGTAEGEIWAGDTLVDLTIRNVTEPALVPVLPAPGTGTGTAVIVVPGGGNVALALGNEGLAVADRLAATGIAAFVLKYRTQPTPADPADFRAMVGAGIAEAMASGGTAPIPGEAEAAADVRAALDWVALNGADFGAERIGVLGFSAGAIAVLNAITAEADPQPSFAGLLYGRMVGVTPPAAPPPLFAALAADDPLFGAQGFGLVESWRSAGGRVEVHLYSGGSHGFGMAPRGTTSDLWLDQFLAWLAAEGFLPTL